MNNDLIEIYKKLRKSKIRNIFIILCIISIVFAVLSFILTGDISSLIGLIPFFCIPTIIFGDLYLNKAYCLKKSLITLATTGSIKYIDEIINKQYETNGDVCFSEHLMLIGWETIIAYKDIVVFTPKPYVGRSARTRNTHSLMTVDGETYNVYFKNSDQIMSEFLKRQRHIIVNNQTKPYKEYYSMILNPEKVKKEKRFDDIFYGSCFVILLAAISLPWITAPKVPIETKFYKNIEEGVNCYIETEMLTKIAERKSKGKIVEYYCLCYSEDKVYGTIALSAKDYNSPEVQAMMEYSSGYNAYKIHEIGAKYSSDYYTYNLGTAPEPIRFYGKTISPRKDYSGVSLAFVNGKHYDMENTGDVHLKARLNKGYERVPTLIAGILTGILIVLIIAIWIAVPTLRRRKKLQSLSMPSNVFYDED